MRASDTHCPWCHAFIDGATPTSGDESESPISGDITVCLYCAHVAIFNGDLTMRKLTPEENEMWATDDRLWNTVSVVKRHGPRDPGRRNE